MKLTEPLNSREDANMLLHCLKEWNDQYYMLAMILLSWGLRISDALALRVGNINYGRGKSPKIYKCIRIREQKTKKYRVIEISEKMRDNLYTHIKKHHRSADGSIDNDAPLICSRKRSKAGDKSAPTREHMSRVVSEACRRVGVGEHVAAHGLRKTWATLNKEAGASTDDIRRALGHSSIDITQRYARFLDDAQRALCTNLDFGFMTRKKVCRVQ